MDPMAIVIGIFALVALWGTFVLTIIIFLKGARIGEDTEAAHGDDPSRTTGR